MRRLIPAILLTGFCGCGAGYTFMPYVGQQQNWTTQPGSYVKVVDNATLYPPGQFPNQPYAIIGSIATDSEGNVAKAVHDQHADAALIYSDRKSPNGAIAIGNPNFTWAIPLTKSEVRAGLIKYTKVIQRKPDAEAYINRGIANKVKGDLDGAIEDFTKAIQLKPGYAAAYYNRGTLEQLKGEVGCAIMDYTKAIELEPDLAVAYSNRGTAKQSKGDFDGATADFTKAIELKPDYADAYCNRGFANQAKGDFDAATADYTKAIEFKPNLMDAYNGRACLRYDSHHFTDALADFRKVVKLDSSNDYARFRVWLIRARQGHAEAATTELQTYLAGRTSGKPDDWASKIGHFLAGQMAEPEFLAAATNADKNTEAGQLCEAYFYAGSKQLFNGGKAAASTYFQKSIATGKNDFLEYFSAVEELKFLKAQN